MIRKLVSITAAFLAFIVIGGTANATTAIPRCPDRNISAEALAHKAESQLHVVKVVVRRNGHALARFSDDTVVRLRPCPDESAHDCWWDARRRGNGIGHSFVQTKGRWFYVSEKQIVR